MTRPEDLAYWISSREVMRIRKDEKQEPPRYKFGYHDDPNMGAVRYCNVRRENDKVTKWIAENWRDPNAHDDNLTLAMVTARMINLPETLDAINYPSAGCDLDRWMTKAKNYIRLCQERGYKAWTAAYTISTCGRPMKKEDYVFDHVLRQVAFPPPSQILPWGEYWKWSAAPNKLEHAHEALMEIDGLGSFLAAQVIADLKNTPGHPLEKAQDWWTWAAPGPGSLRGLSSYFGRPSTAKTFAADLKEVWREVGPLVRPSVGELHMQDLQNCMCEFSKYIRVKEGDGRVRNKYAPR